LLALFSPGVGISGRLRALLARLTSTDGPFEAPSDFSGGTGNVLADCFASFVGIGGGGRLFCTAALAVSNLRDLESASGELGADKADLSGSF